MEGPGDAAAWAKALGISREAVELYLASDVVDLHLDSFIWTRVFGYDLTRRHGRGPLDGRLFSQVDLPRLREARITGGIWSITTNPLRRPAGRARAFTQNLAQLERVFASVPADAVLVRTLADYRRARASGKHAAFVGIQGGNAIDAGALDDRVVKVVLVHLSRSNLGMTSSPYSLGRGADGLTGEGRRYVADLDRRRIFVDLAHVSRQGFFDAVAAHDRTLPLMVSHTGVSGVFPHWRNLADDQLRAVAQTGGVVGVMYQAGFLCEPAREARAQTVVRHLEHVANVAGEEAAALGSDFDGLIVPPRDLATCLELPRLVDAMLRRGFSEARVRGVLGGNFLRALGALRGEQSGARAA